MCGHVMRAPPFSSFAAVVQCTTAAVITWSQSWQNTHTLPLPAIPSPPRLFLSLATTAVLGRWWWRWCDKPDKCAPVSSSSHSAMSALSSLRNSLHFCPVFCVRRVRPLLCTAEGIASAALSVFSSLVTVHYRVCSYGVQKTLTPPTLIATASPAATSI